MGRPEEPEPAPSGGDSTSESGWDAIVVGSGFGGTMAAKVLVEAGLRVLMLERGGWVQRGEHNRSWSVRWEDRPAYSRETPYHVEGESTERIGAFHCVGGASVFYGGVSLRLRKEDFTAHAATTGDVGWPIGYRDLRAHYDAAEALLGVSGDDRGDSCAPPRARPLPLPGLELSPTSRALADAASRLGLHPFRLPMALNHDGRSGRPRCTACGVCDGFVCATGAKNDLAVAVLPRLLADGLTLRPNTVVRRLESVGRRIVAVDAVDATTRRRLRFEADRFVVAAGALATPHLLLASGLDRVSPAGPLVGRHLMRHCNGIVLGAAPASMADADDFRKQLGIHDFYHGDAEHGGVHRKLGGIQQIRATRIALAMAPLPEDVKRELHPALSRLVGFIVMAQDEPRVENRVHLDRVARDHYDRPVARIHHRHTARDRSARRALTHRAAAILREAGAAFTVSLPVRTFSHALGTVRMHDDPARGPLSSDGRFRGVANLWVTDASTFPTAGAVNPSLTVAANALRIASDMVSVEPRTEIEPRRSTELRAMAS
jgi:choline dehydrogenase-like flavoprotein